MKKLRHALYAVLNASEPDSSDYRIANYLIENIYKMQRFGIQDVADACFVSKSSVSRFCRRIGYADFLSMSQSIKYVQMRTYKRFDEYLDLPAEKMADAYLDQMSQCIQQVRAYASPDILSELAGLLFRYDKVGIFGQMQSYSVAMNFQFELASLGKHVASFIMMSQQEDFILESGPEAMAIIISSGGRYFQDFSRYFDYQSKNRPYLVLITNNQRLKKCVPYDKVYIVPCDSNTASQPTSLQIFANLVAMHYSRLLSERPLQETS